MENKTISYIYMIIGMSYLLLAIPFLLKLVTPRCISEVESHNILYLVISLSYIYMSVKYYPDRKGLMIPKHSW